MTSTDMKAVSNESDLADARRMIEDRRFSAAHRSLIRAASLGNRHAAVHLQRLGWMAEQLPAAAPLGKPGPTCFAPTTIALEQTDCQGAYLVPDNFTAFSLRQRGVDNLTMLESNGCSPEDLRVTTRYLGVVSQMLLPVIAERLDTLHGSDFGVEFWRRALGMGFDRHLNLVYDHFRMAEAAMSYHGISAAALDPACYHVPVDYDDLHWFLSDREFGQEQLFSLYCDHFQQDRFPSYRQKFRSNYTLAPLVTPPTANQPVVGILGSWFKARWMRRLVKDSGRDIRSIGYERRFDYSSAVDTDARAWLARSEPGMDRFANFFLSTLASLMPRIFVEDWARAYRSLESQMSLYRRLKYVVSELWIGDAVEPIVTAILMRRGVRLVYHEHNYSEHPYVGSAVPRWSQLCDLYLAHGPHGCQMPNGFDGGSLYDFGDERPPGHPTDHRILYISGLTFMKDSLSSGSSAVQGYAGWSGATMAFKRRFLSALTPQTRSHIHYRGYPLEEYGRNWRRCRDDMTFLKDLLEPASMDDHRRDGKEVMQASRLVVIPYLATSYLESLSMNIPTLMLFSVSQEFMAPHSRDFFAPLMAAGICHEDPQQAAACLERIHNAPEAWWYSEKVQTARRRFLKNALGDPRKTIDLLLRLAREGESHAIHRRRP